jgi:DNA-binding NtrC family response regulator
VKWKEAYRGFGRRYWIDLIERTEANVTHMARESGVNRIDVYKRLRRFGIELPSRPSHSPGRRGNWGDLSNAHPEPTHEL